MDLNDKFRVEKLLQSIDVSSYLSNKFYKNLFEKIPEAENVFADNEKSRYTKFINMLSIFKNLKHFDKKIVAIQSLASRHQGYGVQPHWYNFAAEVLVDVLQETFSEITVEEKLSLEAVFKEVTDIMRQSCESLSETEFVAQEFKAKPDISNLLADIGGEEVVREIHQKFYNVIFEDDWLGGFFYGKNKPTLVRKQTEFILNCIGDYTSYQGETPAMIHMHMFISEEMFLLRQQMLRDAILSSGLSENIAERWLYIDGMFRNGIVKKDVSQCVMKCKGQMPIAPKKPIAYKYYSSVFYDNEKQTKTA